MQQKKDEKIRVPIRLNVIQLFLEMLFSENKNIVFKDYLRLFELFDKMELQYIVGSLNNISINYYIEMIEFFLHEKIVKKNANNKFIISKMLDEHSNRSVFTEIFNVLSEISNDDLTLVRNFIAERLRFIHLYGNLDELEDLLLSLRTNDFESLEDLSGKYDKVISEHFSVLTKTKTNQSDIMNDMVLNESGIETLAIDQIDNLNQVGYTLTTGIDELDKIFGGGITRSEAYLIGGAQGNFKSGTLLNIATNLKLYNKEIITNDKTKKNH